MRRGFLYRVSRGWLWVIATLAIATSIMMTSLALPSTAIGTEESKATAKEVVALGFILILTPLATIYVLRKTRHGR